MYVAAELKIADLLAQGPRSAADLARATRTHRASLHRLLRSLVTLEICDENSDGSFGITSMGRLLQNEAAWSLRNYVIWWGTNLWKTWGNLLYGVQTGESARTLSGDDAGFDYLERDPQTAAVFHRAMAEVTRLDTQRIVQAYDFSKFNRVMDAGGGLGNLLAAILKKHRGLSGILFDVPGVMDGARRYLRAARVSDRCELSAGDFFMSLPRGADAIVLKSVLHDWADRDCRRILVNCRAALGGRGRLLVVERIMPDRLGSTAADRALARADLTMLVTHASRERTEKEHRKLLGSAGFSAA